MESWPGPRSKQLGNLGLRALGFWFVSSAILITPTPASTPVASVPAPATSTPSAGNNGLVTIESDMQQGDNQTGVVTATGNVKITYPDRGMVATSRQAQYFTKEGRLVLSGDVDVVDGQGQRIRAERLVYNLDQERLVAQPAAGQQVKSRLRLSIPNNTLLPSAPTP
jgi:lipopolysaccharide export system protein LptA